METLNNIIIYNSMFNLVSSCCIYSPCYMTNNVWMATLYFNLICICNKLIICCFMNHINIQNSPN